MISRVHVTVESDLAEAKWVENRLHDWHSLLEVANTVGGRVVGSWQALRQKRSVWRMIGPGGRPAPSRREILIVRNPVQSETNCVRRLIGGDRSHLYLRSVNRCTASNETASKSSNV